MKDKKARLMIQALASRMNCDIDWGICGKYPLVVEPPCNRVCEHIRHIGGICCHEVSKGDSGKEGK